MSDELKALDELHQYVLMMPPALWRNPAGTKALLLRKIAMIKEAKEDHETQA